VATTVCFGEALIYPDAFATYMYCKHQLSEAISMREVLSYTACALMLLHRHFIQGKWRERGSAGHPRHNSHTENMTATRAKAVTGGEAQRGAP